MERYTVFITERLKIVGMSVLPRLVCRFNKKIHFLVAGFLVATDKIILKLYGEAKKLEKPKQI